MHKTKVFKSGNSQAVRLPRDYRFKSDEVEIFKRDDEVVIREIPRNLKQAYDLLTNLPDDFMKEGRKDIPPQKRKF